MVEVIIMIRMMLNGGGVDGDDLKIHVDDFSIDVDVDCCW